MRCLQEQDVIRRDSQLLQLCVCSGLPHTCAEKFSGKVEQPLCAQCCSFLASLLLPSILPVTPRALRWPLHSPRSRRTACLPGCWRWFSPEVAPLRSRSNTSTFFANSAQLLLWFAHTNPRLPAEGHAPQPPHSPTKTGRLPCLSGWLAG